MFPLAFGGMPGTRYAVLMREYLRPGNTFVDIGANFGYYTLINAEAVRPDGRVISFEPLPLIAQRLEHSVALNGFDHVRVQQIAIGAEVGKIQLYCPVKHFSGISTVCQDNPWISEIPYYSISVPTAPLSEILPRLDVDRVDAIKIDVEGYELEVLRGALSLLSSHSAPVLFLEILSWAKQESIRPAETLKLLRSLAYSVYRIDQNGATPIWSADQLRYEQDVCAFKPKLHTRMAELIAKIE